MATFKVNESFLYAGEAAADLTARLNHLVKMDNNGNIALCGAAEKALGSIYEVPLSATAPFGPATVQFGGIAKVKAGAAVPAGTRVNSDSTGRVVAGSTNAVGVALEAATAADQLVAVALIG